jgi:hypothetical protein
MTVPMGLVTPNCPVFWQTERQKDRQTDTSIPQSSNYTVGLLAWSEGRSATSTVLQLMQVIVSVDSMSVSHITESLQLRCWKSRYICFLHPCCTLRHCISSVKTVFAILHSINDKTSHYITYRFPFFSPESTGFMYNWIPSWKRIPLEQLIFAKIVIKFPVLYKPQMFIRAFITARNWSHPVPVEPSPYSRKYFLMIYSKFSSHPHIIPPSSRFSAKILH